MGCGTRSHMRGRRRPRFFMRLCAGGGQCRKCGAGLKKKTARWSSAACVPFASLSSSAGTAGFAVLGRPRPAPHLPTMLHRPPKATNAKLATWICSGGGYSVLRSTCPSSSSSRPIQFRLQAKTNNGKNKTHRIIKHVSFATCTPFTTAFRNMPLYTLHIRTASIPPFCWRYMQSASAHSQTCAFVLLSCSLTLAT